MFVNPDSGEIALRSRSPVALGMVLVVLSFAVSLGYSHFLLQPIDEQALAITEHAVPSLQHLATMRVELARLGRMVRDAATSDNPTANAALPAIGLTRERIETEFRLFRALPTSAAESQWVPTSSSASDNCDALPTPW